MSCARLEQVLVAAPSAEALAHAKGCGECGPARAAWEAMGKVGAAAPASLEKARQAALTELAAHPTARQWWLDALILLTVNLGIAATASALLEWHQVQHGSPVMRWGVAGGLVALMAAGAWAAVQPGLHLVRVCVIAFAALVAMWTGLGSSGADPGAPFGAGVGCAVMEGAMAVIPLAVALWVSCRFAFDFTRALTGGASVGATGMLVLHFHCANGTPAHLVAFHLVPWLAVVLGTVALRRVLPTRAYAP